MMTQDGVDFSKGKTQIACDFDGVIHSYIGGWRGFDTIVDPPVKGAIEWLEEMCAHKDVKVTIHSCRLVVEDEMKEDAVNAVREYLRTHGLSERAINCMDYWQSEGKPHADIYLDDKGFRFKGEFPSLEDIQRLEAWNKDQWSR